MLLGAVGPYRMLLAGDVEQAIDPSLLEQRLPRLDFLKVAHHGSKTATTQAFVDAVRPKVAVASAGTGNPYGHPARATLDRLAAAGARVFRTDLDGTVVATFGAGGMTVHAEGGRPVPARATTPTARAAAFRCGIPTGALIPEREPAAGTTAATVQPRPTTTVGYHRADDGPGARGRRLPPALPGSPALVRAARARRGRGRRLAGGAHRRPRDRGGPAAGRGRGAAPRRGQGAPGRRSGARPPPWRGIGGLAHPAWGTRSWPAPSPSHPVTRLLDGERYQRWAAFASREERIVAYADKRAGQRLESMDARFASWRRRYPNLTDGDRQVAGWDDAALRAVRARAARLEADVCQAAGVAPADVRRLAWTGRRAPRRGGTRMTTVPIAYVWGDDEYAIERTVGDFARRLAAEAGTPLERWDLRVRAEPGGRCSSRTSASASGRA